MMQPPGKKCDLSLKCTLGSTLILSDGNEKRFTFLNGEKQTTCRFQYTYVPVILDKVMLMLFKLEPATPAT